MVEPGTETGTSWLVGRDPDQRLAGVRIIRECCFRLKTNLYLSFGRKLTPQNFEAALVFSSLSFSYVINKSVIDVSIWFLLIERY